MLLIDERIRATRRWLEKRLLEAFGDVDNGEDRIGVFSGITGTTGPRRATMTDSFVARHLIKNFFAKIKQFRAIATRYEKTARNFLAAVQLVASVVWLN